MRIEPVRQGDIVDIVAPASRCSEEELKNAVTGLLKMGLVPRVPRNLFAKSLLFSNTDQVRLEHLRQAIYAPDSSLIWCVRGGYGALRLMPHIEKWKKPKRAKIFLGYSDITTLHAFFNQKWNWPTLHGPLLDRFGRAAMSMGENRQLFGMLFGQIQTTEFRSLKPLNSAALKKREIKGFIRGGNFTVLQSSLGTPSAFEGGKHILFLEDANERPHRVDRMLSQFAQAGVFNKVQAIVFGYFQLPDPKDRRNLWNDVMARFANESKIPVLKGLPVGHDPNRQYTLPLNTSARLILGVKPELFVSSGIEPA